MLLGRACTRRKAVVYLMMAIFVSLVWTSGIQQQSDSIPIEGLLAIRIEEPHPAPRICSQQERRTLLKSMCGGKHARLKAQNPPNSYDVYERLYVDEKHEILYCAVPRAASTTVLSMMYLAVTGKTLADPHCASCMREEGIVQLRSITNYTAIQNMLKSFTKVIVVRHPFERLASCWYDKFTRPFQQPTWLDHGPEMISMFRTIPANSSLAEEIKRGATMTEFLRYIDYLERVKVKPHSPMWMPIYTRCYPCSIDYDMIIKMENFASEFKLLKTRLSMDENRFMWLKARRMGMQPRDSPYHISLPDYNRTDMNRFLVERIQDMYSTDMDLFGYSWNPTNLSADCGSNHQRCC